MAASLGGVSLRLEATIREEGGATRRVPAPTDPPVPRDVQGSNIPRSVLGSVRTAARTACGADVPNGVVTRTFDNTRRSSNIWGFGSEKGVLYCFGVLPSYRHKGRARYKLRKPSPFYERTMCTTLQHVFVGVYRGQAFFF